MFKNTKSCLILTILMAFAIKIDADSIVAALWGGFADVTTSVNNLVYNNAQGVPQGNIAIYSIDPNTGVWYFFKDSAKSCSANTDCPIADNPYPTLNNQRCVNGTCKGIGDPCPAAQKFLKIFYNGDTSFTTYADNGGNGGIISSLSSPGAGINLSKKMFAAFYGSTQDVTNLVTAGQQFASQNLINNGALTADGGPIKSIGCSPNRLAVLYQSDIQSGRFFNTANIFTPDANGNIQVPASSQLTIGAQQQAIMGQQQANQAAIQGATNADITISNKQLETQTNIVDQAAIKAAPAALDQAGIAGTSKTAAIKNVAENLDVSVEKIEKAISLAPTKPIAKKGCKLGSSPVAGLNGVLCSASNVKSATWNGKKTNNCKVVLKNPAVTKTITTTKALCTKAKVLGNR
ncbi:MAG: hypothetical protein P4L22_00205 [Candidatus Babeliales bacterium]|nr:hypothetical protein [Candidatus Babeliales bacterium]